MSCSTCNPPEPSSSGTTGCCSDVSMICQPPVPVTTVVAGPQGPTGPTGPQGPVGPRGFTGVTGQSGVQGVQGPQGLRGVTGPQGATGIAGDANPLAFFTGAYWNPVYPYADALNALTAEKIINFGAVPFNSGTYLFHFEIQVAWNANGGDTSGDLFITQNIGEGEIGLKAIPFAKLTRNVGNVVYGTVESYSIWATLDITQGLSLYLKGNQQLLIGAQCVVFNLPSYTITSPGFIN
jgi:hypothetical protein